MSLPAAIKEQLTCLLPLGTQIRDLELRKKQATLEEDFQLAHMLKVEIEELRAKAASIRFGLGGAGAMQLCLPNVRSLSDAHTTRQSLAQAPVPQSAMSAQAASNVGGVLPVMESPPSNRRSATPSPSAAQASAAPTTAVNPYDELPAVAKGRPTAPEEIDTSSGVARLQPDVASSSVDPRTLVHFEQAIAQLVSEHAGTTDCPEDIRRDAAKYFNFAEMVAALGLYATSCLLSKKYQLRESASSVLGAKADELLQHCSGCSGCQCSALLPTEQRVWRQ